MNTEKEIFVDWDIYGTAYYICKIDERRRVIGALDPMGYYEIYLEEDKKRNGILGLFEREKKEVIVKGYERNKTPKMEYLVARVAVYIENRERLPAIPGPVA